MTTINNTQSSVYSFNQPGTGFNSNSVGNGQGTSQSNTALNSAMADSLMKGLFKGGKYNGSADNMVDDPLMQQVASYMDQNPGKYGKPNDATGRVRSWSQELAEDNKMSGGEKSQFKSGLQDFLSQGMGGARGTSMGNTGIVPNTGISGNSLGQLGNNALSNSIANGANGSGQILDLFKSLMQMVAKMMDTNNSAFGSPVGQTSPLANAAMPGQSSAKGMNSGTADAMADTMMKGLFKGGKYNGSADNMVDDPLMKQVAAFMDQNPGKYGSPHDATGRVRTWGQELSEDNRMSGGEKKQFKAALKDMLATSFGNNGTAMNSGLGMNGLGGQSALGNTGFGNSASASGLNGNAMGKLLQTLLMASLVNGIASQAGNSLGGLGNAAMGGLNNAFGSHTSGMGQVLGIMGDMLKLAATLMDNNSSTFGKPMSATLQ